MTKNKVFLAIQSLLCVALAAMLAAAAISICREGLAQREAGDPLAWIYTREKIADRLAPIAPVFLASVVMAAAGLILGVRDRRQDQPAPDETAWRDLLRARVGAPSEAVRREARLQRLFTAAGWGMFGACMIPALIYLLRPEHFPVDGLEGMFSSLVWALVPWIALGLAGLTTFALLRDRSIRREITAARTCLQQGNKVKKKGVPGRDGVAAAFRWALLIAALGMIVIGAANGGLRDVLIKAINLCTECVGLG